MNAIGSVRFGLLIATTSVACNAPSAEPLRLAMIKAPVVVDCMETAEAIVACATENVYPLTVDSVEQTATGVAYLPEQTCSVTVVGYDEAGAEVCLSESVQVEPDESTVDMAWAWCGCPEEGTETGPEELRAVVIQVSMGADTEPPPPSLPPELLGVGFSPASPTVGEEFTITATAFDDVAVAAITFYGDDPPSVNCTVTAEADFVAVCVADEPGTYPFSIVAEDNEGLTAQADIEVEVVPAPEPEEPCTPQYVIVSGGDGFHSSTGIGLRLEKDPFTDTGSSWQYCLQEGYAPITFTRTTLLRNEVLAESQNIDETLEPGTCTEPWDTPQLWFGACSLNDPCTFRGQLITSSAKTSQTLTVSRQCL